MHIHQMHPSKRHHHPINPFTSHWKTFWAWNGLLVGLAEAEGDVIDTQLPYMSHDLLVLISGFHHGKKVFHHWILNNGINGGWISADPGLGQGRGGAWDHRRCGACFVTAMAFTLSKVVLATSACLCLSGLPSFKRLIHGRSSNNGLSGTCFVTAMAFTLSKLVLATSACLCLSGLPSFKRLIHGRSSNNGLSLFKRSAKSQRPSSRHSPQPSVFKGVQACRLRAFKPLKP